MTNSRFQFILVIAGVEHIVNPAYKKLNKEFNIEDGGAILKDAFSGTLVFMEADFKLLLEIEQSAGRCQEITVIIKRCCNGDFMEWDRGLLLLSNGDWNLLAGTFSAKIESAAANVIIDSKKDVIVNVLDVGLNKVTAVYGDDIAVNSDKNCTKRVGNFKYQNIEFCGDNSSGEWSVKQISISGKAQVSGTNVTITWIKSVAGKKIFTFLDPAKSSAQAIPMDEITTAQTFVFDYLGSSTFRSNNRYRRLNDLLIYFANRIFNLKIKSDFFQINPENSTNINYVTGELSQVIHLLIAQVTDVQRPRSDRVATIANITWAQLWNDLVTLFNLDFRIIEGVLEIEHVSFFRSGPIQDLTKKPELDKFLAGVSKYTYDNEKQYPEEVWKIHNAIKNNEVLTKLVLPDHRGVPIYYNNGCTFITRGEKKKEWKTEVLCPDIYSVLTGYTQVNCNGEFYEKDPTSKDGLVIIATEQINPSQYRMLSEPGILSTQVEPNNCLSVSHIQNKYFRHNRSFRFGYMNNKQEIFESSIKAKIGVEFKIPLCCKTDLDLNAPIKTALGIGEVQKATFDYNSEWIALTLCYPTDEYETDVEQAPLVIDDNFEVKMELPTILNVLENDQNVGDSIIEIIEKPKHGIALVAGSQVRYVGDIGYRNDFPEGLPLETFVYRLKKGNVYSNNGLVKLRVLGLQNPFTPIRGRNDDGVVDDKYTVDMGTTLTVNAADGVLANDIFHNLNNTVKYKVTECLVYNGRTKEGGYVMLKSDGSFVYNPSSPTYQGIDEFEYVAYFPGYDPNQYSLHRIAKVTIMVEKSMEIHAYGEIINQYTFMRGNMNGDLSVALYYDKEKKFPCTVSNLTVRVHILEDNTIYDNVSQYKNIQFRNAQRVVFESNKHVYQQSTMNHTHATNGFSIKVGTEPGDYINYPVKAGGRG